MAEAPKNFQVHPHPLPDLFSEFREGSFLDQISNDFCENLLPQEVSVDRSYFKWGELVNIFKFRDKAPIASTSFFQR